MVEFDTDNITQKKDPWLIRFIDKTDLFASVFWIVWALDMVFLSIFVDYYLLCFEIPFYVVILAAIITAVLAIKIKRYCFSDGFDDKKLLLFYGWNAVGPLLYNLIFLPLVESRLYNYSGIILGGLEQYLLRIFNIALAIIFLIVNAIISVVRRKREALGITSNPNKYKNISRGLGIITMIVGLYLLIFVGGESMINDVMADVRYKKESSNTAFKQEMNDHPGKINLAKSEAVKAVKLVEMIADGQTIDDETKASFKISATSVSQDVLDKGSNELLDFLKDAKLIKPFSEQDGAVYTMFFADDRTVHFAFPSQFIGVEGKTKKCTFVCKYDDKWNLKDMYILTEKLTEKTRK